MRYSNEYPFSEAKIHPGLKSAVFYSYEGLRICDLEGAVTAEAFFPDPLSVIDTQYDEVNGNVAVIYEEAFRLYSGLDGRLLIEKQGKPGVKSVVYTDFGVSVLDESGMVTLYDIADGRTIETAAAASDTERALPLGGGLLTVKGGEVFFDGRRAGAGGIIGAGRTGGDEYAFAISDESEGAVFLAKNGALEEAFTFKAAGRAEVYFTGGFAFISLLRGGASVYTLEGELARTFDEKGYLAETGVLGDFITAGYAGASSERYSFLLDAETLEPVAELPGFLGLVDDTTLALDDGAGRLRAAKLYSLHELTDMARLRLDGRALTPEEKEKFRAG
jgi:hypothetical protein